MQYIKIEGNRRLVKAVVSTQWGDPKEPRSCAWRVRKDCIPRRGIFGEENFELAFVTHRCYDTSGAKVFLFPPGLARKRMWNKKYPICILFPEDVDLKTKALATKDQDVDSPGEENPKKKEVSGHCPAEAQERTLYLFGRTGRDKEEWYQYLTRACQAEYHELHHTSQGIIQPIPAGKETHNHSSSSSTEDLLPAPKTKELSINDQEKLLLDYNVYMSQIIPAVTDSDPKSCPNRADSPGSKKFPGDENLTSNPPIVWVNAMLGRMFWDFLREKYWADQVSDKIQKKLGRIKVRKAAFPCLLEQTSRGQRNPAQSYPAIQEEG